MLKSYFYLFNNKYENLINLSTIVKTNIIDYKLIQLK
jgi:hypothetical protein